jgi:3-oxoadipate enol-lactonase
VALIHSLAMDHAYWTPVAQRLASAGVSAVAMDCRGHGASDKPAGPYTLATFAADHVALFDHLGWKSAVVGGSSMGGSVALALATGHPDRVSGLALIDTTSWYGEDAPKAWEQRAQAALDKGLSSLIDFQRTRWFGDAFRAEHPEVVDACIETFLKNDIRAYAETCRMLGNFDLRDRLSSLKMPVRIVVGDEDYATPPAMADVMHAAIPQSTYRLLVKARHLTPLERPNEVTEEILKVVEAARG